MSMCLVGGIVVVVGCDWWWCLERVFEGVF